MPPDNPMSLKERLGLHRPELRAWAMYDWANSVFMTIGLLVFPIYYADVVAAALGVAVSSDGSIRSVRSGSPGSRM